MRTQLLLTSGLLILIMAITIGIMPGLGRADAEEPPVEQVLTVQPGDTLWQIAVRISPKADPRKTIDQLMKWNDLRSPVIHPGQTLVWFQ